MGAELDREKISKNVGLNGGGLERLDRALKNFCPMGFMPKKFSVHVQ